MYCLCCVSVSRICAFSIGEQHEDASLLGDAARNCWAEFAAPDSRSPMAVIGSLAEHREFVAVGAKPPCRFQDRAGAPLMTEGGWKAEGRLMVEQ